MSEELKQILKYLKKKENTRRIKVITITEAEELYRYIVNTEDSLDFNLRSIDKEIEENRKLEERIDKAIEYIEKNKYDIETTFRISSKEFLEENVTNVVPSFRLLEILKGEDE